MSVFGSKSREMDDLRAKLEAAIKERDEAKAALADLRPLRCSFCGKIQHEVRKLIAGPTVFICDECVGLCVDIIAGEGVAQ